LRANRLDFGIAVKLAAQISKLGTGIIRNFKKLGFLTADFTDYTDFWVKNKGDGVKL